MPSASDIDRLIEDGLDRYGSGDLDGALMAWEQALAIDPDNKQANSYVDYVRQNYEMLADANIDVDDGEAAPFAISERPEYHIDGKPGELARPSQPSFPPAATKDEELDSGWSIDEETRENPVGDALPPPALTPSIAPPSGEIALDPRLVNVTFELDAGEPPEPEPRSPADTPPGGISFEEATREYSSRGIHPPEPASESAAAEFEPEGTPVGFASQATGVKQRDLGFVQVKSEAQPPDPELGVTFRTTKKTSPPPAPRPPAESEPELELGAAGTSASTAARSATRELPQSTRPPAVRDVTAVSQAEVMLAHAATQELARDVIANMRLEDNPNVTAPTRDLGLRPEIRIPDSEDDVPTRESDARAIREHAASNQRQVSSRPPTERTRHDIKLPFDPVDAKAAQILDDVDAGAPAGESDEDRSRRRITALFERAIAYNHVGETEKAVLAIDLALDEDPASALAQKMIHRNRDAAMQVFQAYLGDLERQPQLAKPLSDLSKVPINPRAAFLMSRIDGMLSIDEVLDVSGMPRLEAYRYLCQLFLRGILK